MKENEIEATEWHAGYHELPKATSKSPCHRIWVSQNGKIKGIDTIAAESVYQLRKYGKSSGTGFTFPAFNLKALYRVTDKDKIGRIETFQKNGVSSASELDEIESFCVESNWQSSKMAGADQALASVSSELLAIIENQKSKNQEPEEETVLEALIAAIKKISGFHAAIEEFIINSLTTTPNVSLLLKFLFYLVDPEKQATNDNGANLSVFLDLYEYNDYGYPVAHSHTTKWLNDILLREERSDESEVSNVPEEQDAFGLPYKEIGKPMPEVKLGGFDVKLRSMFDAQPCQLRYGKINDASYPIAMPNRDSLSAALSWIAKPENKDKFWTTISKDECVFAYPAKLKLKLMPILGGVSKEARFESTSENFIKIYKGLSPENEPENIQIFSIRKMDNARRKVTFYHYCSLELLLQALEEWQMGGKNVPTFDQCNPLIPFPLRVSEIVNQVWRYDGRKTTVKQIKYYEGMELFLKLSRANAIAYYLHILLDHSKSLFIRFGGRYKDYLTQKEHLGYLLSLTGILLYKQGHKKEDYMEQTAFLLGQMLKISDELHTLYCKVVRKGEMPSQLAGNSMLTAAAENPVKAVAMLGQRMVPYLQWAKKYRFESIPAENSNDDNDTESEENWKAGWCLKLYEKNADKLQHIWTAPIQFSDADKAQLFIGYLASFPKS